MLNLTNLENNYQLEKLSLLNNIHNYNVITNNFTVINTYIFNFNVEKNSKFYFDINVYNPTLNNANFKVYINNTLIINSNINSNNFSKIVQLFSRKNMVEVKIESNKNIVVNLNIIGLVKSLCSSAYNFCEINNRLNYFKLENNILSMYSSENLENLINTYSSGLSNKNINGVINYSYSNNKFSYLQFKNSALICSDGTSEEQFSSENFSNVASMYYCNYKNFDRFFITKNNKDLYCTFCSGTSNLSSFNKVSSNINPLHIKSILPIIFLGDYKYYVLMVQDYNNIIYYAKFTIENLVNKSLTFTKLECCNSVSVVCLNNTLNIFYSINNITKEYVINLSDNNKVCNTYENLRGKTIFNNKKIQLNYTGFNIEN